MGLFSSTYVTRVATFVSRVVKDTDIHSSAKIGIIRGLFEDGEQLVENSLEAQIHGIGIRGDRMYSNAKAKYPWGLPSGKLMTTANGQTIVTTIIKALVSPDIVVGYYHLGKINYLHLGWMKLLSDYAYNSKTNELPGLTTINAGNKTYLKDMVVYVSKNIVVDTDNDSLEQWGVSPKKGFAPSRTFNTPGITASTGFSGVVVDSTISGVQVKFTYEWEVTTITIENREVVIIDGKEVVVNPGIEIKTVTRHEDSKIFIFSEYSDNDDYFHVKYSLNDIDSYWLYKLGSGTYPEIDGYFAANLNPLGSFMPWTYFKQADYLDVPKYAADYKIVKNVLKKLGMDPQMIIDGIKKNPDQDKVEQALLMFAVPPNTTNSAEQHYLFEFFSKVYLAAGGISVDAGWELGVIDGKPENNNHGFPTTPEEEAAKNALSKAKTPKISLIIQDKNLKTAITCQAIYKKKKAGVIAAVGKYTSEFTTENIKFTYVTRTVTYEDNKEVIVETPHEIMRPIDLHIFRQQVADVVYEEIRVYDLQYKYYMWGDYSTLGDNTDSILLIPLDHEITKNFPLQERELLYTRGMHFIFNARTVTEVYWYQSGWFQFVIMVVAAVVTIICMDPEIFIWAIAVSAGTMTVFQFIIAVAMGYLLPYVLGALVFKLFVKAIGIKLAFIAAILALVWGQFKNISFSIPGVPFAADLLTLGNGLIVEVNSAIKGLVNDLLGEYSTFQSYLKDKSELIEAAQMSLYHDVRLSPMVFIDKTPEDFYNRTIHSGNVGMVAIDAVAHYVDIALTLPDINDSQERIQYA